MGTMETKDKLESLHSLIREVSDKSKSLCEKLSAILGIVVGTKPRGKIGTFDDIPSIIDFVVNLVLLSAEKMTPAQISNTREDFACIMSAINEEVK